MRSWFSRRVAPGRPADTADAYKEGRLDESRRSEKERRAEVEEAYHKGRRQAQRRGHPIIALILVILALAALGFFYLSWREGSFSGGGAIIDRAFSSARERAQVPVRNAAARTGSALESAGQKLENRANTP